MLTTEFLSRNQIAKYGSWLKAQDPQTLHNYFGYSMGQQAIDSLVKQFECNPKNNHFLIAKVDGQWAGTIHLATHGQEVEFGVIVALQYRKQGIANTLMDEATHRHYSLYVLEPFYADRIAFFAPNGSWTESASFVIFAADLAFALPNPPLLALGL